MMTNIEEKYILQSEKSVIGKAVIDDSAIAELVDLLEPSNFYSDAGMKSWEKIREMYNAGDTIDQVTVSESLMDCGAVPPDYIVECVEHAEITSDHEEHAKRILRNDALEKIKHAGHRLAKGEAEDPRKLVSEASKYFEDITQQVDEGEEDSVDAADQLSESVDRAKSGDMSEGFKTGLMDVDNKLGGVEPGSTCVIAGRPSMGKTSYQRQIALRLSREVPVAFFSAEMTPQSLCEAVMISEAGVRYSEIRNGRISDKKRDKVDDLISDLKSRDLIIDKCRSTEIEHIVNRIRVLKETEDIEAVFIDYIQLLTSASGQSRQEQVGNISRRLKQTAQQLEVAMFVAAQLNRNVEHRNPPKPKLSDLRDSGEIEQDADYVMLLYRPHYYFPDEAEEGDAEIIIAKHRMGETGPIDVSWRAKRMKFEDYYPEGVNLK